MRAEKLSENVMLYCGDCREILPVLGKVDAVVTDPPYGISHVKGDSGRGQHNRRNSNMPVVGDDIDFDPLYVVSLAREVVLWGANHFAQRLPHGRWLVWDKLNGVASFDSFSDVEIAWHSRRGADRIFRHMWKGICQDSEKGALREHPTQKPIVLMRWCIEQIHKDAQTILDPYMGSGTTGIAAVELGRRFVGIEIEPKYFDIALRRISAAIEKPDMFRPASERVHTPEPSLFASGVARRGIR